MTLSERNIFFKAGIGLSILCLIICIFASIKLIPVYASIEASIAHRSEGISQLFIGQFLDARLVAANGSIFGMILVSLITLVLIYFFFEKTQSPEILFLGIFAASFSIETLRLVLPLEQMYEIPSLYVLLSTRILLFARNFGIFSLFASGIIAAGYVVQSYRNVVLFIIVPALLIALGIPIDTQAWDSSLIMITGYVTMFRLVEAALFLSTAISFFVAVWSKGSQKYILIGIGSVLAILGRNILLSADTWAGMSAGLVLLAVGMWLICTRLHTIYLWL
ncbi:MAG: hypothetical protein FWG89_09750 [Treponema sp.]|nr:hypothetical protein [Treponema sp.]